VENERFAKPMTFVITQKANGTPMMMTSNGNKSLNKVLGNAEMSATNVELATGIMLSIEKKCLTPNDLVYFND